MEYPPRHHKIPKRMHPNAKSPSVMGKQRSPSPSQLYVDRDTITVEIDADLLKCRVCFAPLKSPLFQCSKGHISCSQCCTDNGALDYECLMCREPATATRCRAMERVLDGLFLPCAFRERGCHEMVAYAEKQAHEESCHYVPCHCPIAGCDGYDNGVSLREHVVMAHRELPRTRVAPRRLTALRMRAGEEARVLCFGTGSTQFLLVVGRDMPDSGCALSMIQLIDGPLEDQDFKYKIEVVSEAGVLSLSGQPAGVERLTEPYVANAFLFVPNALWNKTPQDVPLFVELK